MPEAVDHLTQLVLRERLARFDVRAIEPAGRRRAAVVVAVTEAGLGAGAHVELRQPLAQHQLGQVIDGLRHRKALSCIVTTRAGCGSRDRSSVGIACGRRVASGRIMR